MLGFAANGGTTGGSNGPVVYISNISDLYDYACDIEPRTLVITTNIVSPEKVIIEMGANKSIIGSWKANIIDNVYLEASEKSSNIILQNLVFKHDVRNIRNEETQLIFQYGCCYWIDHCTFDGRESHEYDLGKLLKMNVLKTLNYIITILAFL
ncbi:pectin lyase-like [Belonocnema kinseyi]|uniref:pectin lyase-like n=1 Tax=Belonocnema kinseyi TaxID=2817044 RepID=UPI00143DC774|nr:pectin lyase-like [Belonocnema kinseyi]